ncbi:MAG: potassium transporter [Flavobacterium sp.]|uniref:TrkH family potassium uptake protein n=1 Tax=unclassified Flavobacterium TaxID=196869 RepID=UPI000C45CC1E|nr:MULTISPECIES: potassium transporter TrkG [unclassified Flavobacterium]MBF02778.1 potassium transporter [Flavobacterium sp.]MBF04286.1 potassium transporter [Flavobacterium sp.]MCO6161799.1 potassium transporter [Flavobacterium sp. NRK F7]
MERESLLNYIYRFFDIIVLLFIVFDFGYDFAENFNSPHVIGLIILTILLLVFNTFKFFIYKYKSNKKVALVNMIIISLLLAISLIIAILNTDFSYHYILQKIKPVLEGGLIMYFLLRLLVLVRHIYDIYFNPAIVFVGSFLILALSGAFLLMLPSATTNGISFTNALFTATSAVCVTGLAVVDTGVDFTTVGQSIILVLIQLGGIGILTFTSFFAFFFRGSSSFKEGLNTKDFIAQEGLKDVFRAALNVVIFTVSIEIIGALFIYSSIANNYAITNKLFFSLFHSISAFCNAGFSIFSNGLYDESIRFHYYFQWIIMILIVFGGLGHNIIFNFYRYLKTYVLELFDKKLIHKQVPVITLNTKIVIYTTIILLFGGWVFLFISEYNNTLLEHPTVFGKITNAAFSSVTPRTAGFNVVDYTSMTVPSLLFIIFLMWIGASPASTGGGVKTSTFALATLNIFAVAKGKSRIQIFGRRITSESTSRAFAILCISLIVIGVAIMALLIFEPKDTPVLTVVFECFSAYSTVGLSLNFTPTLSEPSKYVIIAVMFIGRIGMLNLMIGLLRQMNHQFYEYPKENILIN